MYIVVMNIGMYISIYTYALGYTKIVYRVYGCKVDMYNVIMPIVVLVACLFPVMIIES